MKTVLHSIAAASLALVTLTGAASASTVLYSDDFNRADNNTVGNGWSEVNRNRNDVKVRKGKLRLRDESAGSVDAAAATSVIDATGFEDLTVSFRWRSLRDNDIDDTLTLSYASAPTPALTDVRSWSHVFTGSNDGNGWSRGTISFGSDLDGAQFSLMFWTSVNGATEGFWIDDVVVSGSAIPAVPLPATLPLLGLALLGAGTALRRKAA